jgi:hypothetical protein
MLSLLLLALVVHFVSAQDCSCSSCANAGAPNWYCPYSLCSCIIVSPSSQCFCGTTSGCHCGGENYPAFSSVDACNSKCNLPPTTRTTTTTTTTPPTSSASLTTPEPTTPAASQFPIPFAAIFGGVTGLMVGALIVGLIVYCCSRKEHTYQAQ